jgi:hypothetical protein
LNYVYPVQIRYADSKPILILYNDNGRLISASDYIQKYPNEFDDYLNVNFMSQVYIKYDNGMEVYVNRHPTKDWIINKDNRSKTISANLIDQNGTQQFFGSSIQSRFILPQKNGWLCLIP